MSFTPITVVATYVHADGVSPQSGTVTFTLSQEMANGGKVSAPSPVTARLDATGSISVVLVANDDVGTLPLGTVYYVDELIDGAQRHWLLTVPRATPGGVLNLATVAPAVATSAAYGYLLSSTVGQPNGVAALDGTGKVPAAQLRASIGGVIVTGAPTAGQSVLASGPTTAGWGPSNALEKVPFITYTHSYGAVTAPCTVATWCDRVASRLGMTRDNRSVSGVSTWQIALGVLQGFVAGSGTIPKWAPPGITTAGPWTTGNYGVVAIEGCINDIQGSGNDPLVQSGIRNALRVIASVCQAQVINDDSSGGFTYAGASWATVASSYFRGGASRQASAVGDKVTFSTSSSDVDILVWVAAGSPNSGAFAVTLSGLPAGCTVDGVTIGAGGTYVLPPPTGIAPAGFGILAGPDSLVPSVVRVRGMGNTIQTLALTVTTAAAGWRLIFDGNTQPSIDPPTMLFVKDPAWWWTQYDVGFTDAQYDFGLAACNAAIDQVVAEIAAYPPQGNAVGGAPIAVSADTGKWWTRSLSVGWDAIHPSDIGADQMARAVIEQLLTLPFRPGQNLSPSAIGSTPDAGPSGRAGIVCGPVTVVAAGNPALGNALYFPGDPHARVRVGQGGSLVDLTSMSMTMECWANIDPVNAGLQSFAGLAGCYGTGLDATVTNNADDNGLFYFLQGRLLWQIQGQSVGTAGTIAPGRHFIEGVYDKPNNRQCLYLDGVLAAVQTLPALVPTGGHCALELGNAFGFFNGFAFKGSIEEFRRSNTARHSSTVTGATVYTPPTVPLGSDANTLVYLPCDVINPL